MENLIVGEFQGLVLVTQRHMESCETKGALKKEKRHHSIWQHGGM